MELQLLLEQDQTNIVVKTTAKKIKMCPALSLDLV